MATRAQLLKASKKGRKSPKTGKHGKSKANKAKDIAFKEQLDYYRGIAAQHFQKLTENDIKYARKQGNWKARNMVLDRLMGKAPQKLELLGEGGGPMKLDIRILKAMKKVYGDKDKKQ